MLSATEDTGAVLSTYLLARTTVTSVWQQRGMGRSIYESGGRARPTAGVGGGGGGTLAAEKAARREEASAAAAEIAQLTERLTAGEQALRHSDMYDISCPDVSTEPSYATAPETGQGVEPDLEQARAPCPLAGPTTLFARGLG